MTLPNFLIVGAAGSGTTSLFQYLNQHPEIYMSVIKEPCYFSDGPPNLVRTDEEYEMLFSDRTTEKAVGEASASYLRDPEAPQRIRRLLKDVRIIVMLRNPADRAYSSWGKIFYKYGCEKLSFEDALREEKARIDSHEFRKNWPLNWRSYHYFHNGLYYEQVKRYSDTFGRERVKVLIFEEFVEDPARTCKEVFSFLGVDPNFRPVFEKHNVASVSRIGIVHRFLANPPSFLEKAYLALPMRLRTLVHRGGKFVYLLNQYQTPRPHLDDRSRSELMERYREDIEKLEELLGRELSVWYS